MGVELPLRVVVTILECCVTFSGVKLSIRSFVLFLYWQQNASCNEEISSWQITKFNLDKRRKKPCGSLICTFQPSENSLPTWCDCTTQLTHGTFLKIHSLRCQKEAFDSSNSLTIMPAGLSDLLQMQNVQSCSSFHH